MEEKKKNTKSIFKHLAIKLMLSLIFSFFILVFMMKVRIEMNIRFSDSLLEVN